MSESKQFVLGRMLCMAVAKATSLPAVREAEISATNDDVTTISMTFAPTAQQMDAICLALAEIAAGKPAAAMLLVNNGWAQKCPLTDA